MTELKRALQRMMSLVAPLTPDTPAAVNTAPLEFDPVWHGDHWQNLLSSPMDARHYVMEDWAVPVHYDFADTPTENAPAEKAA
jgi:hypothetical protein